MITFARGSRAFNYRVVGVALHDDKVLIHRAEHEDFWTLPGGRCELGEPATLSLEREMQEELGVEARVERLLWVVENFFEYLDKSWHELALYFLVSFPHSPDFYERAEPFFGYEDFYEHSEPGLKLIFQWQPLDQLENLKLYPSFLKHKLSALPESTEHLVHVDEIG